jgi:phosphate transport system substrate-binding protein
MSTKSVIYVNPIEMAGMLRKSKPDRHCGVSRDGPKGNDLSRTSRAPRVALTSKFTGAGLLASVGIAASAIALAVPASSQAKAQTITLLGSGSSAAQPYMLKLFKAYSELHPNVHFSYAPDGGNAGVSDVQSGRSEFAIQTAPPVPADSGTIFDKLFLDALCVDVNKSNSIANVSTSDLKNIFTGVDSNWGQVSGSNLSSTIDPYGRTPTAGQYTFFKSAVLGSSSQAEPLVQEKSSDPLVAQAVGSDTAGIGYVGLANSKLGGERSISVNGVSCTAANVKKKSYPLFRYDWGVLPQKSPSLQVEQFFDWVRTSAAAGKVINAAGAVAAFNQ